MQSTINEGLHIAAEKKARDRSIYICACLCVLTFSALLIVSAIQPTGIWATLLLVIVIATISPSYGLGLAIFLAPIQHLPAVGARDMNLFHGVFWSYVGIRLLIELRPSDLAKVNLASSFAPLFLGLFSVLLVAHNNLFGTSLYFMEVGFVAIMLSISISVALSERLSVYLAKIVFTAIITSIVVTILYDAALIYVPTPILAPSGAVLPPDMVRLAGLHINPNATAKFIAMGAAILAPFGIAFAFTNGKRRGAATVVAAILLIAVVATESKSAIIGLSVVLIGFPVAYALKYRQGWKLAAVFSIGIFCVLIAIISAWSLWVGVALKRHAAGEWLKVVHEARPDLSVLVGGGATPHGRAIVPQSGRPTEKDVSRDIVASLRDQFRIGHSYQLKGEVASQGDLRSPFSSRLSTYEAKERKCWLYCTGQRDLLWGAGWEIVRENWLWGAGFGSWKRNLEARLGFPFDSPHSGFLELWGEFGLLGAALYILFIVAAIRRVCSFPEALRVTSVWPLLLGVSAAVFCMLAIEMFEPGKFFALSPHFIWIWTLIALQDRALSKSGPISTQ